MKYIQEPSRRQEGHDVLDGSREEEYKVVLDFSSYYIIDGWLHPWFMIIHHINLAGCRQRGKLMEEVEERDEAHGCHEDQEFLFVIIVHVGSC